MQVKAFTIEEWSYICVYGFSQSLVPLIDKALVIWLQEELHGLSSLQLDTWTQQIKQQYLSHN